MIDGAAPHPTYRAASLPWLSRIPAGWEVRRIKSLFRERDDRSTDGTGELLSLTRARGILPQSEASTRIASVDNLSGYKRCRPGDLVMNRMQASSGMFAVSSFDGLVSPDYSVFSAINDADQRYFTYLFKTPLLVDQFAQLSRGVGSGFNRLYTPEFGAVPVVVPPRAEQEAIVRFLDHTDRRVRRVIRAKQKLIALLNEQKQAVIHRAVTRGLDPSVRLKPSGVDWLGDVPEYWEVLPLRRRWSVTDCKHLTVPFVDEGIPLASVREVQTFELSLAKAKRTSAEWYETLISGGRQPRRGDLIYCRNVSVGAAALVDTDEQFAMGQDVCVIRSREQNQRYLNYFLRSAGMKRQLASLLVGSTFNRINVADIKNLTIVVPPRSDQDAIVDHLDKELRGADIAIETGREEIELLREYRTRLIADVVTGKFDVRETAAQLPDEAHKPGPLDQFDLEAVDEVDAEDVEEIEVEA